MEGAASSGQGALEWQACLGLCNCWQPLQGVIRYCSCACRIGSIVWCDRDLEQVYLCEASYLGGTYSLMTYKLAWPNT